jgi:hypothetical protein
LRRKFEAITGACSKSKEETRAFEKADSAHVTSKENVTGKGSVFAHLRPIVDTLIDGPPAAAPPVKVSQVAPPQWLALNLKLPLSPQSLV